MLRSSCEYGCRSLANDIVRFCTFYSANMEQSTIYHHNVKVISLVLFLKCSCPCFKSCINSSLYRIETCFPPSQGVKLLAIEN